MIDRGVLAGLAILLSPLAAQAQAAVKVGTVKSISTVATLTPAFLATSIMVMREPVMKGIVQELYHQHNKYCRSSMTIKKEEYRWGAQHTAVFFWGPCRNNRSPSWRSPG